jgi:hypothetical protein
MSKRVVSPVLMCQTCQANSATHRLVNGEETTIECEVCMQKTIFDMANNNDSLYIRNRGKDKFDGLIKFELQ